MRGPKRPMVLRLKSFSIGVPVKPTITALGKGFGHAPAENAVLRAVGPRPS